MLEIRPLDERRLVLAGIDPAIADCLRQVGPILDRRDAAGARERLHPDALPHDGARNAEWHRLMDDDLRHLFEAAQATMQADLAGLDAERGEVVFPAEHLRAWMSALNQARIVLSEQHQFDAGDMRRDDFAVGSPRDAALLQVQVLGYVLQVLVEHALEGA